MRAQQDSEPLATSQSEPPIMAVSYSAVKEIKAKEFLFIGHANLDGFDHTAVAKPALSNRQRRMAGLSCTGSARNTRQMTLHGMVAHNAQRIHFVFPSEAIWAADIWGPNEKRPYPAPMVLLTTLFGHRANDTQAYSEVVPLLDRLTMWLLVGGYPPDFAAPLMSDRMNHGIRRFETPLVNTYGVSEDLSPNARVRFQGPSTSVMLTARPLECWLLSRETPL